MKSVIEFCCLDRSKKEIGFCYFSILFYILLIFSLSLSLTFIFSTFQFHLSFLAKIINSNSVRNMLLADSTGDNFLCIGIRINVQIWMNEWKWNWNRKFAHHIYVNRGWNYTVNDFFSAFQFRFFFFLNFFRINIK